MMKDINLTWKADGNIDSYTIYRSEDESIDVNNLPPPLIAGVTVKGYTDNYVGDATSIHYRIASVKGDRKKISGEYIVEIGGSDIPSNEMHFTTLAGSVDYVGTQGDQILLSDGSIVDITVTDDTVTFNAPAGRHIVKLVESVGRRNYVSVGGEALAELHNFPALSTVTKFNFSTYNYNPLPNLTKVPDFLPSSIVIISYMFCNAAAFNQDISMWDTSNVTNMIGMFEGASAFNQPLNNWNVSNVTDMSYMFRYATSFNQDLSNWCVSNLPNMPDEFNNGATLLVGANLPVWGTCPAP